MCLLLLDTCTFLLLASQSIIHGLALLTPDRHLARYPVRVMW